MTPPVLPAPLEHTEQANFLKECELHQSRYPALSLIFAVPNAARRSRIHGSYMNAEGLRAGVPDLFLPWPVGAYHGLFIEMKRLPRVRDSEVSEKQRIWIDALRSAGYRVEVARGAAHAWELTQKYLTGKLTPNVPSCDAIHAANVTASAKPGFAGSRDGAAKQRKAAKNAGAGAMVGNQRLTPAQLSRLTKGVRAKEAAVREARSG